MFWCFLKLGSVLSGVLCCSVYTIKSWREAPDFARDLCLCGAWLLSERVKVVNFLLILWHVSTELKERAFWTLTFYCAMVQCFNSSRSTAHLIVTVIIGIIAY